MYKDYLGSKISESLFYWLYLCLIEICCFDGIGYIDFLTKEKKYFF
jgi:hypothetical protein